MDANWKKLKTFSFSVEFKKWRTVEVELGKLPFWSRNSFRHISNWCLECITVYCYHSHLVCIMLVKHPGLFEINAHLCLVLFQSTIDFWASFMLLLGFTTVEDNKIEFTGFRADALCKLWYTKLFLWSLLVSSTWNLVILTIERFVIKHVLIFS